MLRAGLIVWGGWLVLTGVIISFASGIIHPYYTVVLAPAIGALLGMIVPLLWQPAGRDLVAGALAGMLVAHGRVGVRPARPDAGLAAVAALDGAGRRTRGRARPPGERLDRPMGAAPGRGCRHRGGGGAGGTRRSPGVHGGHRGPAAHRPDPLGRSRPARAEGSAAPAAAGRPGGGFGGGPATARRRRTWADGRPQLPAGAAPQRNAGAARRRRRGGPAADGGGFRRPRRRSRRRARREHVRSTARSSRCCRRPPRRTGGRRR